MEHMPSVLIIQCFICKVSLYPVLLYAKCHYSPVLYMQSVLIMQCFICKVKWLGILTTWLSLSLLPPRGSLSCLHVALPRLHVALSPASTWLSLLPPWLSLLPPRGSLSCLRVPLSPSRAHCFPAQITPPKHVSSSAEIARSDDSVGSIACGPVRPKRYLRSPR